MHAGVCLFGTHFPGLYRETTRTTALLGSKSEFLRSRCPCLPAEKVSRMMVERLKAAMDSCGFCSCSLQQLGANGPRRRRGCRDSGVCVCVSVCVGSVAWCLMFILVCSQPVRVVDDGGSLNHGSASLALGFFRCFG